MDHSTADPTTDRGRRNSGAPTVAILGGGLAGLAAAHGLLRRSEMPPPRVVVLERRSEPGGLARSIRFAGMTSDLGPHRVYSAIPEANRWFRDFLGDRLVTVQRRSAMRLRGRYLNYPPGVLDGPTWLRAIGPVDFARFSAGYAAARARAFRAGDEPPDFAAAMRRSLGEPLCQALVFPYARKMWGLEPEGISAQVARARATMGGLATMLRRALFPREARGRETSLAAFGYIPGGIGRLPEALADDVRERGGEIVTNARVRRVEVREGRIARVEWSAENATGDSRNAGDVRGGGALDVDVAIGTIPLAALVHMLVTPEGEPALAAAAREAADGLRTLDLYLSLVALDRDSVGREQWYYFPEAEPDINRVSAPRRFHRGMGPAGRTLLCLESTRLHGDPRADAPPDPDRLARDLAATGLFAPEEILETCVVHVPDAYPLLDVGAPARLARVLEALSHFDNLLPLGRQGLFQHNNMDHAVWSGLRAAERCLDASPPADAWHRREIPRFRQFKIVD